MEYFTTYFSVKANFDTKIPRMAIGFNYLDRSWYEGPLYPLSVIQDFPIWDYNDTASTYIFRGNEHNQDWRVHVPFNSKFRVGGKNLLKELPTMESLNITIGIYPCTCLSVLRLSRSHQKASILLPIDHLSDLKFTCIFCEILILTLSYLNANRYQVRVYLYRPEHSRTALHTFRWRL